MKFFQLMVLSFDHANRSCHRSHHGGFGLNKMLAKLNTRRRATSVTPVAAKRQSPSPCLRSRDLLSIANSGGALALFIGVEHLSALHLATDTA
jgi:hypothetical protein